MMQPNALSMKESAERLRARLETLKWPQSYMFKFILPNDRQKIDTLLEILPTTGKVTFGNSKGGKYTSVTCVAVMMSAEQTMQVTQKACQIEGLISL